MKDQDLKNLFKSLKYEEPSEIQRARWKKAIRQELLNRTPSEWARLAVACLIGVVIGATAFQRGPKTVESENFAEDATIEMVHVNLQ